MKELKSINKSIKQFIIVLVGLCVIFACEGPEGPAGTNGPTGPQGAPGNQGPAGNQGPTGIQGETGSANVFFSSWINNSWTRMPDNYVWDTIPAPQITEDILNKGVVVAYFRENSFSNLAKVYPAQIYQTGSNIWMFTLEMKAIKGNLILYHLPSRVPVSDATNIIPFSQVRYMVIPGVTLSSRLNFPDLTDYEAVCAYFGVNP